MANAGAVLGTLSLTAPLNSGNGMVGVTVTVAGGPPTTASPSVRHFLVSGLAERRKAGLEAIAHLRFIQENFVDQQVSSVAFGPGEMTQQEAVERLSVLSLLARWVDQCDLIEASDGAS
jgi:hypothetical protein